MGWAETDEPIRKGLRHGQYGAQGCGIAIPLRRPGHHGRTARMAEQTMGIQPDQTHRTGAARRTAQRHVRRSRRRRAHRNAIACEQRMPSRTPRQSHLHQRVHEHGRRRGDMDRRLHDVRTVRHHRHRRLPDLAHPARTPHSCSYSPEIPRLFRCDAGFLGYRLD